MQKDFDSWNSKKKTVHASNVAPLFHEREIWFCSLGVNVGFEQDGTGLNFDRPILILRGFNKNTFLAVAIVGKKKEGDFYSPIGSITGREASANLSQVRLVDSKRLVKKVATLDEATFFKLKEKLKYVLFPEK